MIKAIAFCALCLGLFSSQPSAISDETAALVIGPADNVTMETSGQCMPSRLSKTPHILPKQKCRLG